MTGFGYRVLSLHHRRQPYRQPYFSSGSRLVFSNETILLRCGSCGSGMATNGRDKSGRVRIRCLAATERGTCPDAKTFYLDTVESAVLGGLKIELHAPKVIFGICTHVVPPASLIEERLRPTHETDDVHRHAGFVGVRT